LQGVVNQFAIKKPFGQIKKTIVSPAPYHPDRNSAKKIPHFRAGQEWKIIACKEGIKQESTKSYSVFWPRPPHLLTRCFRLSCFHLPEG
jgi:hypothetical protein